MLNEAHSIPGFTKARATAPKSHRREWGLPVQLPSYWLSLPSPSTMESLLPVINKLQDVFNALGSDPLGNVTSRDLVCDVLAA